MQFIIMHIGDILLICLLNYMIFIKFEICYDCLIIFVTYQIMCIEQTFHFCCEFNNDTVPFVIFILFTLYTIYLLSFFYFQLIIWLMHCASFNYIKCFDMLQNEIKEKQSNVALYVNKIRDFYWSHDIEYFGLENWN